MTESKQNSFRRVASLMLAALIVMIFLGVYLINATRENVIAEQSMFLSELSVKNAMLADAKVEKLISTVEKSAAKISAIDTSNLAAIISQLKYDSMNNGFKRMGYVDKDGNCHTNDGFSADVSDREYFSEVMSGQSTISSRTEDLWDGDDISVIAAPVYRGSLVIGAVLAVRSSSSLTADTQVESFGGLGYSYIITSEGAPVVYTQNPTGPRHFSNLFEEMRVHSSNEDAVNTIYEDIKSGKNGLASVYRSDGSRYIAYVKMNVKDWYMIASVDELFVTRMSSEIVSRTGAVIIIFIAMSIAFCLYIIRHFKLTNKSLETIAFTDEVTGYGNWSKFCIDCKKALNQGGLAKYAMIILDVDKFKVLNDVFGNEKGNDVLKYICAVIELSGSQSICFARSTSDHFCVLRRYDDENEIVNFAHSVSSALRHYIEDYQIDLSFGVYFIDEKGLEVRTMSDRAALAKRTIKNRIDTKYSIYSSEIREEILREKELENEMSYALVHGQFEVFLHPKFQITDGKTVGAEALVRWNHPVKGYLPPNDFIPLFEKNGFIANLDLNVFEQVCGILKRWESTDCGFEPIPISVNLSRAHVATPGLAAKMRTVADRFSIDPKMLEIELTETAVIQDKAHLATIMNEFKSAGFLISIDDFGSGYSSLNTLMDLPADIIKLDGAFLRETANSKKGKIIVHSLIDMTKNLKMLTVAEGVETAEQVEFLRSIGCELGQGFYYAKPMPIAQFEDMIKRLNALGI